MEHTTPEARPEPSPPASRRSPNHPETLLGVGLDVFRLRQYFDVLVRARDLAEGVRHDAGFLDALRRAVLPLPVDRAPVATDPFGSMGRAERSRSRPADRRRWGVVATGGSGAMASLVGAARALEEVGIAPAVLSVCSGSALFGFPLAAGLPPAEVARFVLSLRPADYVDVDWGRLATLAPRAGRGFAGILRGDGIESAYRTLLGDLRLGELPVPCYAPIWNIEENRVAYLGPRTHPGLPVARAVRMAISLPLFVDPVPLDGGWWCDGGIVDIFPVRPVLDIEDRCDAVLALNGFYPPGFAGEDARGWRDRALSILHVASQVRTCQQAELAREHLARLVHETDLVLVEPVPYDVVRGIGFYRQFVDNRDWAEFMRAGRAATLTALADRRSSASRRA